VDATHSLTAESKNSSRDEFLVTSKDDEELQERQPLFNSEAVEDRLLLKLRAMYNRLKAEPVPDRHLAFISQLNTGA